MGDVWSTIAICRISIKDAANFNASAIALDSPIKYILEIDLEYPHLHNRHTDLPFCLTRDKSPGKREDELFSDAVR